MRGSLLWDFNGHDVPFFLCVFVINQQPAAIEEGCKLWKNNIYQIWFLKIFFWGRRIHSFRRKFTKSKHLASPKMKRHLAGCAASPKGLVAHQEIPMGIIFGKSKNMMQQCFQAYVWSGMLPQQQSTIYVFVQLVILFNFHLPLSLGGWSIPMYDQIYMCMMIHDRQKTRINIHCHVRNSKGTPCPIGSMGLVYLPT